MTIEIFNVESSCHPSSDATTSFLQSKQFLRLGEGNTALAVVEFKNADLTILLRDYNSAIGQEATDLGVRICIP